MKHVALSVALISLASLAAAQTTQPAGITVGQALALAPAGRAQRNAGTIDNVELSIVRGTFKPPGTQPDSKWHAIQPDKKGDYRDRALSGGWIYLPVESPDDRIVLMTALGDSIAYVNGDPRGGDVYSDGYIALPIQLHKGTNDLLFNCARGQFRVTFEPIRGDVMFNPKDVTAGDLVNNYPTKYGVVVLNATTQPVSPTITGDASLARPQPILPLSLRKIILNVPQAPSGETGLLALTVTDNGATDQASVKFNRREAINTHRVAFISEIDDSVQYFSVVPATQPTAPKHATVLSLHGAAVEATNQAGAYSPKSWCDIVCPTNRRPYGFDWEDWGRTDALEVLNLWTTTNEDTFDPSRVYLTGHSMGGHGVWTVGSVFPDKFAAIGPSAGWLSFDTYGGGRSSTRPATATTSTTQPTVAELFKRNTLPSDTPQMMPNLWATGVYALHGVDDDNVPIAQARMGMKILDAFNHDHQLFEKPGVGHWWDDSDEPGAACVDWPAMFDFFARHRLPSDEEVRDIDFRTPDPAVSNTCFWATIEQQIEPGKMSAIKLHFDPLRAIVSGTTENVRRLRIATLVDHWAGTKFKIDDQTFNCSQDILRYPDAFYLQRTIGKWQASWDPMAANVKSPSHCGPFKQAFNHHMLWVYGTSGTAEENAALLAKVRYDAELWYVRANGSVDVMSDREFLEGDHSTDGRFTSRNVILYGNADTNRAWSAVLGDDTPIAIHQNKVVLRDHEIAGDDLATLFVYPRLHSDIALVGVVGSTGVVGTRLTYRLPYFSSTGFPDWCVLDPTILEKGLRDARAAGYFDNDWNFDPENSAFAE